MNKFKKNMKIFIKRWKSKTPNFFKKIIRISTAINLGLGAYVGTITTYGGTIPQWVLVAMGIFGGLAVAAKFTSENPKEAENVENEVNNNEQPQP